MGCCKKASATLLLGLFLLRGVLVILVFFQG